MAALFAVHPLHVESVAWVAERKDVLAGFFWFLTIWTYVRYVERPIWTRYAWVVVAFGCGLMAKPIVVTLPIVLLLLDVWPLERVSPTTRPAGEPNTKPRKGAQRARATADRIDGAPGLTGWALVREKVPSWFSPWRRRSSR